MRKIFGNIKINDYICNVKSDNFMTQNDYKNYTTYIKLFNIKFDFKKNLNINKTSIPISPLMGGKECLFSCELK